MNISVPTIATESKRKYGVVKWFGGQNHTTGRPNNFGFIESISGKDVFLHKLEWKDKGIPDEGDLVTYIEEESDERKGKYNARFASRLDGAVMSVVELYGSLQAPVFSADQRSSSSLRQQLYAAISEKLCKNLPDAKTEQLKQLIQMSNGNNEPTIFSVIATAPDASNNFALLLSAGELSITDDAPWAALPGSVMVDFEDEIAAHIAKLDPSEAVEKCGRHLNLMPVPLLTFLLTQQIYQSSKQLGIASARVYDYLKLVLVKGTEAFPTYLQASFDADIRNNGGMPSNQVLFDIIENLNFKKSLYEKNLAFISIYTNSARLNRNIETFILFELLSLILAGNEREVVYSVFQQRLWEAIQTKMSLSEFLCESGVMK